jgi:ketosteroid isomerase-like protein
LASTPASTKSGRSSRRIGSLLFPSFPFDEWKVELDELIDNGDQVIAVSRQRGRGASSGVGAELEQAFIITVGDGEIVRVESYLDRDKAFEAAGLSR